jgi:hypothetical protein
VQAPLYAVRRCKAAEGDAMVQVRESWCSSGSRRAAFRQAALPHCQVPPGTDAFYVVSRSTFIDDIQKLHVKGYDASGNDDVELEEVEEFSDDEKEEAARQARRQQKRASDGETAPRDAMPQAPAPQQRPRGGAGRKAGPPSHGGHVAQQAGMQLPPGWGMPPRGAPWGQMPAGGQIPWGNGMPPGGQMPPYGMPWPQYGAWPPPQGR